MHVLTALVVALFLSIFAVAAPAESNGQRLARGLPPLRPRFGSNLPGFVRTLDDPTPVLVAKRSAPSGTVSTHTGQIEVRDKNNQPLGTVKNWAGQDPINGVNHGDPHHSLHVTFTTSSSRNGPLDLSATNALFQAPYYVGLAGQNNLGHGSANTVELTNVNQTPGGSPPVRGVESAVWSFNSNTNELTAHWVNPDGSTPTTVLGFDAHNNKFIVTGDLDEWNQEHPDIDAEPVSFFLVPV